MTTPTPAPCTCCGRPCVAARSREHRICATCRTLGVTPEPLPMEVD